MIQSRTQANNRVVKVLEDTNIKLTSVVSDLFGRSGRRRLVALLAGERDPKTLAALALGVLRRKLVLGSELEVRKERLIVLGNYPGFYGGRGSLQLLTRPRPF